MAPPTAEPQPNANAHEGAWAEARPHVFETVRLLRALDDKLVSLQQNGEVAYYTSAAGEELATVAAAAALRPSDWLFPSTRDQGAALGRGTTLARLVHHFFGTAEDSAKGRQKPNLFGDPEHRVAGVSGGASAHLPHAVGFAWAARSRKEDIVVLAMFGEGATSEGEFHNAANFAGVMKAPVVFFCRNNDHAGHTPASRQTVSSSFAEKAVAYGFDGVVVDGGDPQAVFEAVRAAIAKAARGGGATLIEARTADLASKTTLSTLTPSSEHVAAVEAAVSAAKNAAKPSPQTLFDDVYAELPPHLALQRNELMNTKGTPS
ncbi:MAG: thiamine pyrophosphate-dependent dehydrogenase E1 component subunit alpha [Polyangiaceae bacterium]